MRLRLVPLFLLALVPLVWGQRAPAASTTVPFVQGKRWAIVIGAEGYEDYAPLKYACDDARAVADTLVQRFRFEPDTLRLLTDDGEAKDTPTAGHIIGELETLLADPRLDKGDLFVFFFAGHGVGLPEGDFLLPTDARKASAKVVGVPVASLVQRFVKRGLKNVLIIADACRSGKENPFGEELQRLGREANIAVMLGTAPGQRSYEEGRLQHGVFAYHLLRVLEDPKARNPVSGALWASEVGKRVQSETQADTERDYGDDAQVPAVWSSPTEDVLLAAYPPESGDPETVAAFREQAKSLDPDAFVAAMTEYASVLLDGGRPEDAVEILRAAESIGLSPFGTYMLGLTFYLTERQAEASKRFRQVRTEDPASYFGSLSASFDPDTSFDPVERAKAAQRVFALGHDSVSAYVAWSVLKLYAQKDAQIAFLRDVQKLEELPSRFRDYFAGEAAVLENRLEDARQAFGRVANRTEDPEEEPTANIGALLLANLLETQGARAEFAKLVDQRIEAGGSHVSIWHVKKAQILRDQGDRAGAVAEVKLAFESVRDADSMLQGLRVLGADSAQVAQEAAAIAQRFKYSWKARLAASVADALQGGSEALLKAYAEAESYAPDPVGLRIEFVELFDAFLGDAFDQGKVPAETYAMFANGAFLMLDEVRKDLGPTVYGWWPLVRMGAMMERQMQVARACREQFGKLIDAGTVPADALSTLVIAFAGAGDDATCEKLETMALAAGPVASDAIRHLAFTHAMRGRPDRARALLAKFTPYPGAEGLGETLLRAYLDADGPKRDEILKTLSDSEPVEGYARALKGLALLKLGKKEDAVPLLEESRTERSWGYPFVHLEAMRQLGDLARAAGEDAKVDALAYDASIAQLGSPLIADFAYTGAGAGRFAGSIEWNVDAVDDAMERSTGKLTLSATSQGKASGLFETGDGTLFAISGTVDANGNLLATVRSGGKSQELFAKIPPLSTIAEVGPIRERGLLLVLLDDKGVRTTWLAKPAPTTPVVEAGAGITRPRG
ncbi:MAG: caspase family protein [Fimbriimonadaceae bacterium]|nr:caspase family protein [Fimbriimonadaceae bacterium]